MKSIVLVYEGVADQTLEELDGRTPLHMARCRNTSRLAVEGRGGMMAMAKPDLAYRNEVFLARLLGISEEESERIYRGPVEALNPDFELNDSDFVYRANFVTLDGHTVLNGGVDRLGLEETRSLVDSMKDIWEAEGWSISLTEPGSFVVVCRDVEDELPVGHPPYPMEDQDYGYFIPRHKEGRRLRNLLEESHKRLRGHTVNEVRLDLGENPANGFWIWGGGKPYTPQTAPEVKEQRRGVLSQSVLARNLAQLLDIKHFELKRPWDVGEDERVDYPVEVICRAFDRLDFLVVYIEAPKEFGRYGSGADKVRSLEILDRLMVEPIKDIAEAYKPCRVIVATDGAVSSLTKRWEIGNTPFVLAGDEVGVDEVEHWDETACKSGSLGVVRPEEMLRLVRSEF